MLGCHKVSAEWVAGGVVSVPPARHTLLSGSSASAAPKILRPRMEGAEYLMVIVLPLMVADVSAAGLGRWASPIPAVAAIKRADVNTRFSFIPDLILYP